MARYRTEGEGGRHGNRPAKNVALIRGVQFKGESVV